MSTVAEVKAGRISVRTLKSAYTAFIDALRIKRNAGTPITVADMTALVTANYDPVTVAMNDLGTKIDALPDVMFSPNGGAALPPMGQIIDGAGDIWSFTTPRDGEDFPVTRNGVKFFGSMACLIAVYDGKIWMRDSANGWWTRDASGLFVRSLLSPYGVSPIELRKFNTQDGATIVGGSNTAKFSSGVAFVVDMNARKWSLGARAANGKDYIAMCNDLPFMEGGFTAKPYEALQITLKNGTPWMKNAAGAWVYPS